jgi:hypothetical protein
MYYFCVQLLQELSYSFYNRERWFGYGTIRTNKRIVCRLSNPCIVRGERIELTAFSMSRKRSTTELTARVRDSSIFGFFLKHASPCVMQFLLYAVSSPDLSQRSVPWPNSIWFSFFVNSPFIQTRNGFCQWREYADHPLWWLLRSMLLVRSHTGTVC